MVIGVRCTWPCLASKWESLMWYSFDLVQLFGQIDVTRQTNNANFKRKVVMRSAEILFDFQTQYEACYPFRVAVGCADSLCLGIMWAIVFLYFRSIFIQYILSECDSYSISSIILISIFYIPQMATTRQGQLYFQGQGFNDWFLEYMVILSLSICPYIVIFSLSMCPYMVILSSSISLAFYLSLEYFSRFLCALIVPLAFYTP